MVRRKKGSERDWRTGKKMISAAEVGLAMVDESCGMVTGSDVGRNHGSQHH